jgi:hypothetical protein
MRNQVSQMDSVLKIDRRSMAVAGLFGCCLTALTAKFGLSPHALRVENTSARDLATALLADYFHAPTLTGVTQ